MKAILVLFCAFLAAGSGFAQTANHQKIIPIDSDIYQAIKSLYISTGLALPSTTGPWSEEELLRMLNKIDVNQLRPGEQSAYDFAERELTQETKVFTFDFAATVQTMFHTNTTDFVTEDSYATPWNQTLKPFIDLGFEFRFASMFYGFGNIPLVNRIYTGAELDAYGRGPYAASNSFGKYGFATNVLMVPPNGELSYIDFNVPYRTFIAAGTSVWSLEIGRDRLSWGNGESGNFVVGDHIQYHDNIRSTWFGDKFKYTYNISSFQWPGQYYGYDGLGADGVGTTNGNIFSPVGTGWAVMPDGNELNLGLKLFIAHRLEWRVWKLNFALTESVMYQQGPGENFNPTVFIPTMILHNLYKGRTQNSLLAFEADYTVIPALNIYFQMAVDEFSLPGESVPTANEDSTSSAFAFMLGAKTSLPMGSGMLTGSFEFAITDPFLYLRDHGGAGTISAGRQEIGLNFVVANRYRGLGSDNIYVEDFLGYRHGGDAIVLNAKADYRQFGKWSAGVNLMYMIHGTHDKWTVWDEVYSADSAYGPKQYPTPTKSHETENVADEDASRRNIASHTVALSLSGSYLVWQAERWGKLNAFGQIDFVTVVNPGNISSNAAAFDAQFSLGLTYSF
ncbi:hypothetical protein FACS1894164_14430 [Spirochaetia bacterium]|nr:hypothetical protein FACS1894164_14430 [Spirochaetia bacterium]